MPNCDRQISTENGVLTCDLKAGHKDMHHAKHGGGEVPAIDMSKTKDGDPITRDVEGLEILWPQEGDVRPHVIKKV